MVISLEYFSFVLGLYDALVRCIILAIHWYMQWSCIVLEEFLWRSLENVFIKYDFSHAQESPISHKIARYRLFSIEIDSVMQRMVATWGNALGYLGEMPWAKGKFGSFGFVNLSFK